MTSTPAFYDTHAHLNSPDFNNDLPEVISRANAAGITKIVCIATDLESSRRCLDIAERFPGVFAAVGWHPSDAGKAPEDLRPALRELANHPRTVAIGETGLDYYRLPSRVQRADAEADARYKAKQADLFRQHLEVATETGLNCVIHQRECLEDAIAQFQPFADRVRAVFHCFANDSATLHRIVSLGSIVSFTGILTFKNGQNIRDALAAAPTDSFMLETDSPFLAPVPYRGKRCEPAYVKEIAETAARVRGWSLEQLSASTNATAEAFFRGL